MKEPPPNAPADILFNDEVEVSKTITLSLFFAYYDISWASTVEHVRNDQEIFEFLLSTGIFLHFWQNFKLLKRWRLKQEKKLKMKSGTKKNSKIMNEREVETFMMTYQRITQNMFKNMPKYASIILNLNDNHQIKSAVYKTK